MEESEPMTLSDFITKLSSIEEMRNQFDFDNCVVHQIVDPSEGNVNLYCGVKDILQPMVSVPYKTYGMSTANSVQNEQDRIQTFTHLFHELFDTGHPKTNNNLARLRNYEVSVRLMNVTTDPLAALFFACQSDDSDKNRKPEKDNETKNPSPSGAVNLLRFDEGLSHDLTNPYFKEMMNLAFEPKGLSIDSIQDQYPVLSREIGDDLNDQSAWDRLSRPRLILSDKTPYFTKRQAAQRGHFIFLPPLFEIVSIAGKAYLEQVPLFGKTPNGKRTADEYNHQLATSFKVEIPSGSKSGIRTELERLADFPRAMNIPGDIDDIRK